MAVHLGSAAGGAWDGVLMAEAVWPGYQLDPVPAVVRPDGSVEIYARHSSGKWMLFHATGPGPAGVYLALLAVPGRAHPGHPDSGV